MRTNRISFTNIAADWPQDVGLDHEEVDYAFIVRNGVEALNMMNLTEDLSNRLCILQVSNSKVRLPDDFKILLQAAANVRDKDYCTTSREEIIEWTKKTYQQDCDLKIRLECPKCNKSECDCRSFEVNVDRIWELSHPEYYYNHYRRIGSFGRGGKVSSVYNPRFELMRAVTQDFHQANILFGCPNVDCRECAHEFRIDPPFLELDFQEGEVLLSYLGRVLDENGDPMIPDQPDVLDAIQYHLTYKWFNRIYNKSNDRNVATLAKSKAQDALQMREVSMGIAKSFIEMPEYTEFRSWLNGSFYKRYPDMNRDQKGNKHTRDEYEKYSDKMKY